MRAVASASSVIVALLCLVFVPLLWSLGLAVLAGLDRAGWLALWRDTQTLAALGLSLWTGLASAALATAATALLLAHRTAPAQLQRLARRQTFMLAVPHAAFAMGLVLLLAPSGWLLRALSPWATGMLAPPPWPTIKDPWGLGLIAVLTLKEIPFLLWAASAHLLRPDVAQRLQRELQLAASLGYCAQTAWWHIVWPQLLPRLAAPLLAVLAYSLTVVDVALVIGPASPPTLAALAWQWLLDASAWENAKGAAAAWALAASVAMSAGVAWAFLRAPLWRRRGTRGAPQCVRAGLSDASARAAPKLLGAIYLAVLAALLLGSLTGSWPFPDLLPARWTSAAWATVWDSLPTLWTTLWLASSSAACALLWVVVWLEWAPPRWQQRLQAVAYAPLLLPGLLWAIGLHRLALSWALDAAAAGVWLTHSLACLPYVLLTCSGAYTGFDARYAQLAATFGHSRLGFLLRVKWPLLRAALASAFAVGFAVSVAQYLPTLYVGAGRFATVTTEAVTLAAGGQRDLMAAFAWLQWLLPVLVFAAAAWLGRSRHFPQSAQALGTITA
jgi:putative thiamine transport system permease protein